MISYCEVEELRTQNEWPLVTSLFHSVRCDFVAGRAHRGTDSFYRHWFGKPLSRENVQLCRNFYLACLSRISACFLVIDAFLVDGRQGLKALASVWNLVLLQNCSPYFYRAVYTMSVTTRPSSMKTAERIELFWHGSFLRPILHCVIRKF